MSEQGANEKYSCLLNALALSIKKYRNNSSFKEIIETFSEDIGCNYKIYGRENEEFISIVKKLISKERDYFFIRIGENIEEDNTIRDLLFCLERENISIISASILVIRVDSNLYVVFYNIDDTIFGNTIIISNICCIFQYFYIDYINRKREQQKIFDNIKQAIERADISILDNLFSRIQDEHLKNFVQAIRGDQENGNRITIPSSSQLYKIISEILPKKLKEKYNLCEKGIIDKLLSFFTENYYYLEQVRYSLYQIYTDQLFNKEEFCNTCQQLKGLLAKFLYCWSDNNRIYLITDWLSAWFACFLLEQFFNQKGNSWPTYLENLSPNRQRSFLKYFSAYMLYTIHWIKWFGMTDWFPLLDLKEEYKEVIEAKLFLISEYMHKDLDLSRRLPLFYILKKMLSYEAILYTVKDTYREHAHHVLETTFLGLFLIQMDLLKKEKSENFLRDWLLAGLLHDVGYGLDIFKHSLKHVAFLENISEIEKLVEEASDLFKHKKQQLAEKLARDLTSIEPSFQNRLSSIGHGGVSGLYLLSLKEEYSLEDLAQELERVVQAMLKHDSSLAIDAQKDPLSFLLLLCDQLQEWDRPRAGGLEFRSYILAELLRPPASLPGQSTIVNYLTINLDPSLEKDSLIFKKPKNWEIKLYFKEASKEGIEPPVMWVHYTRAFQKIKNFSKNMTISFIHPSKKQEYYQGELEKFADFVFEKGLTPYLGDWIENFIFNEDKSNQNNWFSYQKEEKKEVLNEIFTIEVHKINSQPISHIPDNLYSEYIRWKRGIF